MKRSGRSWGVNSANVTMPLGVMMIALILMPTLLRLVRRSGPQRA